MTPCSLELLHDPQQLLDDERREAERELVDHAAPSGLARNAIATASICC